MNTQTSTNVRRYDIDWLRVLAILSIFLYHSTRFFNLGDWHVKNAVTYVNVELLQEFMEAWMMPVIFLISGASIFYAMNKGGAGKFFKDKLLRLGVPLLVGAFTHASLQVYLERVTHYQFVGSYFEFLPLYFRGFYTEGNASAGNFAWTGMHLWYLLILLIFSSLCYPLFRWLKGSGRKVLNGFGSFLALPGAVYLLFIPIYLFFDAIEDFPLDPGGWPIPVYILFFLAGFILVSHQRLQTQIQRQRWISLVVSAVILAAYFLMPTSRQTSVLKLYDDINGPMYCLISWTFLMAILGFGMLHLNFSTPFLKYANEAVLPFYILHQTVLLSVGYFVLQWNIPDLFKWFLIITASFAIIMLIYEYLVRRWNVMRFLFGMKVMPKVEVPHPSPAPVTQ
jgi:peptidoglycan/LPS O-acetylase OafA/YrhL